MSFNALSYVPNQLLTFTCLPISGDLMTVATVALRPIMSHSAVKLALVSGAGWCSLCNGGKQRHRDTLNSVEDPIQAGGHTYQFFRSLDCEGRIYWMTMEAKLSMSGELFPGTGWCADQRSVVPNPSADLTEPRCQTLSQLHGEIRWDCG